MNVLIIGCGYIGKEVARVLKKRGFHITATTRSPNRLKELSKVAKKSVVFKGNHEEELIPLVAENEMILIAVAAERSEDYESTYLDTAKIIRHLSLEMDTPRHLVYTSSTSVYGDHQGKWVDETSPLLGKTDQAKILIEAEKHYLATEEVGWHVCILRLSEMYGPERELSKRVQQLEHHPLAGSGENYTNMIHRNDCVSGIDYAIRHHLQGIYNLVDDEHPSRKNLYDAVSHKFGLPRVKWDPEHTALHSGNKRISNHKIKSEGFVFSHPHRILD